MVGRDGAVGISSGLDGKVAMSRAIVRLGGDAMMCDQAAFKGAALQSERFIAKVMRHEQTLFAQAQQSTACMAHHESMLGSVAGGCAPAIYREAISSFHAGVFGRNAWRRADQRKHGGAHSPGSRHGPVRTRQN